MALSLRLCVLLVVLVWAQEDALDGREPKVRRALLSSRSGRRLGKLRPWRPWRPVTPVTPVRPVSPPGGGNWPSGGSYIPGYDSYGGSRGVPKDVVINIPGHGLLVADLEPFLDDIPVKWVRESWESPDLIAVPVPGGVVTVPLRKPPKLPTPSNSVPALRPKPHLPGLGEQDVEDEYVVWKPHYPGPIWRIFACSSAEGACLTHDANEGGKNCIANLPPFSVVRVTDFYARYPSRLVVNGAEYSRNILENQTLVLWSSLVWDGLDGHFQICMEAPPLCPDSFELTPVPVEECPAGAEVLSNCEEAEPGELCEGNGQCGTRTDINNCYDSGYTYPASRDVYRKQNFTRNKSNATASTPFTTTTTTGSFTEISLEEEQVDGLWRLQGPCEVHGRCLSSPGYPGRYGDNVTCVASLPPFTALTVERFNTEKFYDQLTVNGIRYSGQGLWGKSFVLWSNITWTSDESNDWLHWKLCLDTPPVCSDGLVLTPVSVPDCPAATERLRDCQRAEPGELCEGDGQCGTRTDINNCYDSGYTYPASRDVYRKHNGTTVSWIVDGPCSVVDGCVQSFHGNGSRSQECNMSLTEAAYVTVRQSRYGAYVGSLQINERSYDLDSIFVNSSIRWTSGPPECEQWNSELGRCLNWFKDSWLICIGKHKLRLSADTSDPGYLNPSTFDATVWIWSCVSVTVIFFFSCCCGCCTYLCKKETEEPEDPEASNSPSFLAIRNYLALHPQNIGVLGDARVIALGLQRFRRGWEVAHAGLPRQGEHNEPPLPVTNQLNGPVPPSLPRQGEHNAPPLPVTNQLNGISAAYILDIFPALARQSTGLENPNFYEMAPVVAMGETGLGYGKTCSEDGEPNCSIVDAVEEHHKGKVSHFVSWCWACRLNDFVGALRAWMEGDRINVREAYLWICFFCDNQYRLPKSGTLFSSANELQTVLESRLARAGQMLFLVDADTTCTKRAWCLFEVFTCVDKQLPITIMLPATREGLQEAFSTIDLRTARATSKADEDMINEVVLTGAGFDAVNARVQGCLLECLKH